jgi:hypothetical protein
MSNNMANNAQLQLHKQTQSIYAIATDFFVSFSAFLEAVAFWQRFYCCCSSFFHPERSPLEWSK